MNDLPADFGAMPRRLAHLIEQSLVLIEQGAAGARSFAESVMREALVTVGHMHPGYTICLNNLADACRREGDLASAERLYHELFQICRNVIGTQHPVFTAGLNNLGVLRMARGDYHAAEPLLLEAWETRRATLGERHLDTITSLGNLAACHSGVGNHEEAIRLSRRVVDILRAMGATKSREYAAALHNLARIHTTLGDYPHAERLIAESLEIRRSVLGALHPEYATGLDQLAGLYVDMRDYDEAQRIHLEALRIRRSMLGERHPDYAISLNNVGELFALRGEYAQARRHHRQALKIKRAVYGSRSSAYLTSIVNLAAVCRAAGQHMRAESLLHVALSLCDVDLKNRAPVHSATLNNLAELYRSTGRLAEAEPLFERSLEIVRGVQGDDHPTCAKLLFNIAALRTATNRGHDAISLMKQAAAIQDRMVRSIFSIGSERQRTIYLDSLQPTFDAFVSLVIGQLHRVRDAVNAAFELVLRRKATGAEALAAQRDAVLGGRYPHLKPQFDGLDRLRRQIAQKVLTGTGDHDPEDYQRTLEEWTAQKERLEADLARQIPEINLEQRLRAASRDAVALHLPADATLVEFVRFNVFDFHAIPAHGEPSWKPARYLAFVLQAGRPDDVQIVDLGEAEPIDRMIAAFREQTVRGGGREPTSAQASSRAEQRDFQPDTGRTERVLVPALGRELYAALIDPLLPALQGTTRLLLSPDGDLTRLPFEVLRADDGTYLTDTCRISYVASGRDVLRRTAERTRVPGPALVAADPDFDLGGATANEAAQTPHDRPLAGRHSRELDRASLRFSRLPGTHLEGERIGKLLDNEPWLEGEVLEARLCARRSPEILHLATHGFFLEDQKIDPNDERSAFGMLSFGMGDERGRLPGRGTENPLLRSGLALAGVNTWLRHGTPPEEAEDGLLTAEDVTRLDLLDTELVVLSACDTGLGEVRVGEGVFGLRRAFVLAGAKTLVMSLWKVPDLATAILMVRFYENLLRKAMERDEALREAQRSLRQTRVSEIREEWLSAEVIAQVSAGRDRTHRELEEMAAQPDDHRPFEHPFYWGAFICQGETRPLRRARRIGPLISDDGAA